MPDYELVRSGCGWPRSCPFKCGGPDSCRAHLSGELQQAIRRARELSRDDPLAVVEVRHQGHTLYTVGYDWTSHRVAGP
jgi:hypothetical protein